MKIFRFTRAMFGLTVSPFLLQATLRHHLAMFQREDPTFVEQVISSLYVDDLTSGDGDDDETFRLYTKPKDRFSAGGFNMRKFLTNSASLQRRIHEDEGVKQLEPATAPEEACEKDATYAKVSVNSQPPHALDSYDKVLGVVWDHQADDIMIDIAACFSAISERPTKRGVASQVARLFDPPWACVTAHGEIEAVLAAAAHNRPGLGGASFVGSRTTAELPATICTPCSAGSNPAMLLHSGAWRESITPWIQRRIESRFCSCCMSTCRG